MEDVFSFIGVDVGTKSVRAAAVTNNGIIKGACVKPLNIWNPFPNIYEQSSTDIWQTTCDAIKEISSSVKNIKGVGFTATCSLVVLDENYENIAVNSDDHRAEKQADKINAEEHHLVLKNVGGKISPEMQIPKLLWMKENLSHWNKMACFFDLPDFLTFMSTGNLSRSFCSSVCKWTYQHSPNEQDHWDRSFFDRIGLEELAHDNWKRIGCLFSHPGEPIGNGLTHESAKKMGLSVQTPVSASLIDAYAAVLGILGTPIANISTDIDERLGVICGTSTCLMKVNKFPIYVEGIWGPYFEVLFPNLWLSEAGQSASGKLFEALFEIHACGSQLLQSHSFSEVCTLLEDQLDKLKREKKLSDINMLTSDLHIWPDFHGNRSPYADSSLLGMIHADVLNLPVVYCITSEASVRGACMLAAAAANMHTINQAMYAMADNGHLIMPNESLIGYHNKKFNVWKKMLQDQLSYRDLMLSS